MGANHPVDGLERFLVFRAEVEVETEGPRVDIGSMRVGRWLFLCLDFWTPWWNSGL